MQDVWLQASYFRECFTIIITIIIILIIIIITVVIIIMKIMKGLQMVVHFEFKSDKRKLSGSGMDQIAIMRSCHFEH